MVRRAAGAVQGAEGVRFVAEMPRNGLGKIQKDELGLQEAAR